MTIENSKLVIAYKGFPSEFRPEVRCSIRNRARGRATRCKRVFFTACTQELMYFIKPVNLQMTKETLGSQAQYGMVTSPGMQTLLRMMNGVYAPQILGNTTAWPESIKKDFTTHFHRFMASLTEATHEMQGKTVLYLPGNLSSINAEEISKAAQDKDLCQQLDSVVIHWTRQIKQVVNNHGDSATNVEASGPLEEISFWRSRTIDLSGISAQLLREDVVKVIDVLESAKVRCHHPPRSVQHD